MPDDKRISDLTTINLTPQDILPVLDVSESNDSLKNKKSTIQQILNLIPTTSSPPNASTSTKGLIRLSGDLSGTADAPTVPSLAEKASSTDLITHTSNVNNPHTLTASQVGNVVPQWNANQLQGRNIASATPTDNQALVWDSINSSWKPGTITGATSTGGGTWYLIDGSTPFTATSGDKLIVIASSTSTLNFPTNASFGNTISLLVISNSVNEILTINSQAIPFNSKPTPLGIILKLVNTVVDFIYINSTIGWVTSIPGVVLVKGADTYFDKVRLLLHCNGVDSSTVFTDVKGNSLTPTGNIRISGAYQKYGNGSIYVDGSQAYLSAPNTDFSITNEDFTIEFYYKDAGTTNGSARILQQSAGDVVGGYEIFFSSNSTLALRLSSSPGSFNITGGSTLGTVSTTEFDHFAVSREGSNIRLFKNLNLVETIVNSSSLYAGTGDFALLGQPGINRTPKGYLDEFRLTIGQARYTATSPPLTEPFGDT